MSIYRWLVVVVAFMAILPAAGSHALEPIPDRLVVLTFDDSVKSQFSVVRPLLKQYGFGATFFITEGFDFRSNKNDYLTWDEITQLHADGFEIGNHTRDHFSVKAENLDLLSEQIDAINAQCRLHGIPEPVSFAYPGNSFHVTALKLLRRHGIQFARRGGEPEFEYREGRGFAYEPGFDHPLLIPSAGDARPDWDLDDFVRAVQQARLGRIVVLQFHGVPDRAHAWVSTSADKFAAYLKYLAMHDYRVIAMRDLARYVDPDLAPTDPHGIIADRKRSLETGKSRDNVRPPRSDDDLRSWLSNMAAHRFSDLEMSAATGLSAREIHDALRRLGMDRDVGVPSPPKGRLRVLPFPGGRHPRIGFRDGAIRPQRETKVSVFPPWADGGYVVVDVPEAIWFEPAGHRELLYLAHTHVPTWWNKQDLELEPLEWARGENDTLSIMRRLPNGVSFGAEITPGTNSVRMELWIANGSKEKLTGLLVQNCVMLGDAPGFNARTNENKVLANPIVACHDPNRGRWIITAWQHCERPWANPPCPCLHSDPRFPDCEPGETRRLTGYLLFHEGPQEDAMAAARSLIEVP